MFQPPEKGERATLNPNLSTKLNLLFSDQGRPWAAARRGGAEFFLGVCFRVDTAFPGIGRRNFALVVPDAFNAAAAKVLHALVLIFSGFLRLSHEKWPIHAGFFM